MLCKTAILAVYPILPIARMHREFSCWRAQSAMDGLQERFLLTLPTECSLRGGKGGTLGLPQGVGRPKKCVEVRRQSRSVAGRIQEYATWCLHCYFPLPGSIAGYNSKSSE
jgi:hypothetical protein